MAPIVLFHSASGLNAAVLAFASELAGEGHDVLTPDLFDGETFTTLEAGVRKRDSIGIPGLMRRARAAVEGWPERTIYAGFSMGAAAAQYLGLTRPGAQAVVLMHAALPPAAFGAEGWPDLPLQIHSSEADPWVDHECLSRFSRLAGVDVLRYPGKGHLFADEGDPDHDPQSAALMRERVRDFIRRHGGPAGS